jgi:hypothetical protein
MENMNFKQNAIKLRANLPVRTTSICSFSVRPVNINRDKNQRDETDPTNVRNRD